MALSSGNSDQAFRQLLQKDINISEIDNNGWTPLAMAIEYERVNVGKELRGGGAVERNEAQLAPSNWNSCSNDGLLNVNGTECTISSEFFSHFPFQNSPIWPILFIYRITLSQIEPALKTWVDEEGRKRLLLVTAKAN